MSAPIHDELRRAQKAFAASQEDLTRVEKECKEALDQGLRRAVQLQQAREDLAAARTARLAAEAELVTARAELERLRKNEELRAVVIRERNAELVRLRAELARLRETREGGAS